MTTLNNRPVQKLTGADLLRKVQELGDISKTDLCLACGFTRGQDEEGNPLPHFTAFYGGVEELLAAKGEQMVLAEEREAQEKQQEEPLLSGLSIEDFHNTVVDHIGETRKLLPYNMPIVDKVCVITQLAALHAHHQRMVQDLEQEGGNTETWMDDIEKLDTCIRLVLSIYLGDDDHWYRNLETVPKVESKGETTVGLQVFTDVVKKANALQAEVDQLKQQLDGMPSQERRVLGLVVPIYGLSSEEGRHHRTTSSSPLGNGKTKGLSNS